MWIATLLKKYYKKFPIVKVKKQLHVSSWRGFMMLLLGITSNDVNDKQIVSEKTNLIVF